jgi:hypothetical protein
VPQIYIKTETGQKEIERRSPGFPARARTLLILVDGKRRDTELAALVPDFATSVALLLQAGLIAPVAAEETAPAPDVAPGSVAAPAPVQAVRSLGELRRDAARAVNDLLGPQGDALAMRIEAAKNVQELQAAIERSAAYIETARGARAAETFSARFPMSRPR